MGPVARRSRWSRLDAPGREGSRTLPDPRAHVSVSHANDRVERDEVVELSRGLLGLFSVGAMAAPFLGGLMMQGLGPPGVFLEIAVAGSAVAAFGLYRMGRRVPVPSAEATDFVSVPQTSPAGSTLDPRQNETPDQATRGRDSARARSAP